MHDDEPTLETAPANSLCFAAHEQLLIWQKLIGCDWLAHYLRLESECSYHQGLYSEAQKRRPRGYRLSRSGTSILGCFRTQCSEFWEYLGAWYAMILVQECSVPGRLTTGSCQHFLLQYSPQKPTQSLVCHETQFSIFQTDLRLSAA